MHTKHTPTPWRVSYRATTDGNISYRIVGVTLDSLSKENAEFIVRAVNSHEALLDAVKKTMATIADDSVTDAQFRYLLNHEHFHILANAIAQAEGQ